MSNHILNELNRLAAKHFPELIRTSAAYKYYTDKKGNRYFYTIERVNCGCKQMPERGHFVCGKYRHFKKKQQFKLTKKRCFSKKYKAIEWAERECDKADK